MAFSPEIFVCALSVIIFISQYNVYHATAPKLGSPLRWGFVGCGRITNDFAAAVDSLPSADHKVVAFASAHNKTRADEYAHRFGSAKSYGSYEELAKDPDVDVVYIGTIHPTHYEISKLLLENNKHILCEKPIMLTKNQTVEILNLATEKKLFYMEAVLSRLFPVYRRLEEILPSIGNIKMVTAYMGQNSLGSLRHTRKEIGGGALKDIGGYVIQFATEVLGKDMPDKIHAVAQLNNESVDSTVSIILQWKDGRIANLGVSLLVGALPADAMIYADNGTVKVPFLNRPDTIEIIRKEKESENRTKEKYNLPKTVKHRQLIERGAGMIYEAEEVRRCIQQGLLESPHITHQDSINIMAIEDEVMKQIGVEYDSLFKDGKYVGSPLRPENDMPTIDQ